MPEMRAAGSTELQQKKESVRNNQRHRVNNVSNLDTRKEINEQKTEKEDPGQRDHEDPGSGRTKGSRKGE